jgi:CBS domain-containing protein
VAIIRDIFARKGCNIISGPPQTTVGNAVRKMIQSNIGSMAVVSGSEIAGIFTERDLLFRVVGPRLNPETVSLGEVMSSPVLCCRPEDDIRDAARWLLEGNFRHLVVLDERGPAGLLSLRDLVREYLRSSGSSASGDDILRSGAELSGIA